MNWSVKLTGAAMLLIAVVAATLLASALPNLHLGPGDPFPAGNQAAVPPEPGVAARGLPAGEVLWAMRGLLAVGLLALGTLLVVRLASLTRLRHLLGLLAGLAVIILLLISLPRLPAGGAIQLEPESVAPPAPSADFATSPLGTPPPSFLWIAGLIVLIGAAMALIVVLRSKPAPLTVTDKLAQEADRALAEIEAGANATSVVVRCYLQMASLIQKERGLSRDRAMTVREFEVNLKDLGLPPGPLLRLRGLFEVVRYGDRLLEAGEEQAAIDSLTEITSSLKSGVT
ncbi:MAG: DUF4129 domain-containing protein [Bacteroidota bacterium]